MPSLGNRFSLRIASMAPRFPRMLRWTTTQYYTYEDFWPFLATRTTAFVVPIVVDEQETHCLQLLGVTPELQLSPTPQVRLKRRKLDFIEEDAPATEPVKKVSVGDEVMRRSSRLEATDASPKQKLKSPVQPEHIPSSPALSKTRVDSQRLPKKADDNNYTLLILNEILKKVEILEMKLSRMDAKFDEYCTRNQKGEADPAMQPPSVDSSENREANPVMEPASNGWNENMERDEVHARKPTVGEGLPYEVPEPEATREEFSEDIQILRMETRHMDKVSTRSNTQKCSPTKTPASQVCPLVGLVRSCPSLRMKSQQHVEPTSPSPSPSPSVPFKKSSVGLTRNGSKVNAAAG